MKRSRFAQEQIIGVVQEHQAGATAPGLCRKHRITETTFVAWRSKDWELEISGAPDHRSLEG